MTRGLMALMSSPDPEWAAASRQFLTWLEQPQNGRDIVELTAWLDKLLELGERTLLPALPDEEAPPYPKLPPDRHQRWLDAAFRRFPDLAGSTGFHEHGFVMDDLSDIAGDFERILAMLDADQGVYVQFEWALMYESHWGKHHALHLLNFLRSRYH
jgi:hypothetical protein